MNTINFGEFCHYARNFCHLDDKKIKLLHQIQPDIHPLLPQVTHSFYQHLQDIPKTAPFLEGRLQQLQMTHQHWMEELFTSDYGEAYTQKLYQVGEIHVRVKLPVEFMTGGMTLIQNELISQIHKITDSKEDCQQVNSAINAAIGFSLLIMQESYQSSSLNQELEKFLAITGISRTLFNNLAKAYSD